MIMMTTRVDWVLSTAEVDGDSGGVLKALTAMCIHRLCTSLYNESRTYVDAYSENVK